MSSQYIDVSGQCIVHDKQHMDGVKQPRHKSGLKQVFEE